MEGNITPTTDNKTKKGIRNTAGWKRNQQKKIRLVLYNIIIIIRYTSEQFLISILLINIKIKNIIFYITT